jgi:hypothetical protein
VAKQEFRDLTDQDDKPYLVKPTAQLDLERRLEDGYVPDAVTGNTVTVNPNPFGADDYVGTDPIYQNHANETEKPLASQEGVLKDAEDAHRELHSLDDLDDGQKAEDYGLGGLASKAGGAVDPFETYLVPGQEGYPENPDKYVGPPVPRSVVEGEKKSSSKEKGEVAKANNPGTNMGATTEDPEPPKNPSQPSDRSGTKSAK